MKEKKCIYAEMSIFIVYYTFFICGREVTQYNDFSNYFFKKRGKISHK